MSDPDIDYYTKGVDKSEIIKLLKEQNLYKLYDIFDKEFKLISDSVNCDQKCIQKLPKTEGDELKLCDLCKKMCNLLLNFSNIQGICTEGPCRNQFFYMNLWLYEKIKKISSSSLLISNFYDALKKIKCTETSRMVDCRIINFNSFDKDFKPIKYLHEFVHIFSDIKEEIDSNHGSKGKLYCKHIQEFFKYYNEIKGNCTKTSRMQYCNEVESISKSIDSVMINTILSKCDYEKTKCENDPSDTFGIPCLKEKEIKSALPKTDGVPPELVRTLSTGVISLIPIVTTISIFYKFTPLGYWLRSKMLKKKNITEHLREVNHDILEHNSRIEEINLNNDRYNIKYN